MKQTKLKIGDKVKIINVDNIFQEKFIGNIFTIKEIDIGCGKTLYFLNNEDNTGFYESELQLIKPKTKKVKKWKYSREELSEMFSGRAGIDGDVVIRDLLATKPQPIKEEDNKDECELCGDRDCRGCPHNKQQSKEIEFEDIKKITLEELRDCDSFGRSRLIWEKQCEIIDQINSKETK